MPSLPNGRGGYTYTGSSTDDPNFKHLPPPDYGGCLRRLLALGLILFVPALVYAGCQAVNRVEANYQRFEDPYLNIDHPGYHTGLRTCDSNDYIVILQRVSGPNARTELTAALEAAGPHARYMRADNGCEEVFGDMWDPTSRYPTWLVFLGAFDRRSDMKAACTRWPAATVVHLNTKPAEPRSCTP